jgi:choline dehydrogenase
LRGAGGPLQVSDQRSPRPLSRRFVAAAETHGIPANTDFNGSTQAGVGLAQVYQRNGRRWSNADAYLRPAAKRPNLTVETGAQATRIELTGERASGVRYRDDRGREQTARAPAPARKPCDTCASALLGRGSKTMHPLVANEHGRLACL